MYIQIAYSWDEDNYIHNLFKTACCIIIIVQLVFIYFSLHYIKYPKPWRSTRKTMRGCCDFRLIFSWQLPIKIPFGCSANSTFWQMTCIKQMNVHNSDNPYPRGSWCLFRIDVSAGAEICNSDNDGCFQFSAALRFGLYYESKANVKLDQSGGIGFVWKWKTAAKKQNKTKHKNKEQHNNTTQHRVFCCIQVTLLLPCS